jgi:hypothetical protein
MNKSESKPQNLHPRVIAYAEFFEIEPQRFLRFLKGSERISGLQERFRAMRRNEHNPIPLKFLIRNFDESPATKKSSTNPDSDA